MIGPYLSEAEFLTTQQRDLIEENRFIWRNTPSLKDNSAHFYLDVFGPVRALLGPLHVTSGYRCPILNSKIGGHPDSQHLRALAADVVPLQHPIGESMSIIAGAMHAGALGRIDKVIIECDAWIHMQAALPGKAPRCLALRSDDGANFRPYTV